VEGIRAATAGWTYDVATLGIPGPVLHGAVVKEPWNLGRGWVGFDFEAACGQQGLAQGLTGEALESLVPHKVFPGNCPSTTIVCRRLDPRTLGMLLAMYEHKVFTMGAVWGMNSFDQWGVELGKQLAKQIAAELSVGQDTSAHDGSTNQLVNLARRRAG
jgi:glucose-6-phosphate isomerase